MGQLRTFLIDEDTACFLRAALTRARDDARRNAKHEPPAHQEMWLDHVRRFDKALEQIGACTDSVSPKQGDFQTR